MDEDEKEFTRIQTDVQILIAICLGLFALAGAFLITSAEYTSITRIIFSVLTVVLGLFAILVAKMAYIERKKMNKPKEKTISISTWNIKVKSRDKEIEVTGTNPEEVKELFKLIDGNPEKSLVKKETEVSS